MPRINLGDKVKCKITGLVGIAIGRTTYLHGCDHIAIKPAEIKDGKPVDAVWLDEPQVEVVKAGHYKVTPAEDRKPGGPSLQRPARKL